MADTIQLRAGNSNKMPELLDREIVYARDEEAIYVGTPAGPVKVGRKLEAALVQINSALATQQAEIEEQAKNQMSAVDALQPLASDATVEDVVAAFNGLIDAMKLSGLMKDG